MKALTLWQPWASLVASGIKTIETRSWSTSYRGRLLIHAAKRPIGNGELYIGDGIRGWTNVTGEPIARGHQMMLGGSDLLVCPLGAVVASCVLTDVVPMIRAVDLTFDTMPKDGWLQLHGTPQVGRPLLVRSPDRLSDSSDVTGQLPYGDFAAGRYAWLLDGIKPTTERCPRCYLRPDPIGPTYRNDMAALRCPTCRGDGRCDPVPMRGRRGLWAPTAQDWS